MNTLYTQEEIDTHFGGFTGWEGVHVRAMKFKEWRAQWGDQTVTVDAWQVRILSKWCRDRELLQTDYIVNRIGGNKT